MQEYWVNVYPNNHVGNPTFAPLSRMARYDGLKALYRIHVKPKLNPIVKLLTQYKVFDVRDKFNWME